MFISATLPTGTPHHSSSDLLDLGSEYLDFMSLRHHLTETGVGNYKEFGGLSCTARARTALYKPGKAMQAPS